MPRLLLAILTGLIGAALLHIIIILALPHFTGSDAYTRVMAEGRANRFHALDDSRDEAGLVNMDPYLKIAVCHFDTATQAERLLARGNSRFWSLSIFDADSNEVFSMNDRTSVDGTLDVLLASPLQLTRLRKTLPAVLSQSILVELPSPSGYAVLRTMAPQTSFEETADDLLSGALCVPF
ncbi:MAG: DUF1254 domain-containing protein [Allorhizobium sp.]